MKFQILNLYLFEKSRAFHYMVISHLKFLLASYFMLYVYISINIDIINYRQENLNTILLNVVSQFLNTSFVSNFFNGMWCYRCFIVMLLLFNVSFVKFQWIVKLQMASMMFIYIYIYTYIYIYIYMYVCMYACMCFLTWLFTCS